MDEVNKLGIFGNGQMLDKVSESREEKKFKKLTCMTRIEDFLIPQNGVVTPVKRRYRYEFGTLKNDLGFGAQTGDFIEHMSIYSFDGAKYETGKSYWVEIKES